VDRRVAVAPLDVDAIPVLAFGTAIFAVALVVVLLTGGPSTWRWVCLCGIGLGLVTMPICRRRQRRSRVEVPLR